MKESALACCSPALPAGTHGLVLHNNYKSVVFKMFVFCVMGGCLSGYLHVYIVFITSASLQIINCPTGCIPYT